MFENKFNSKKVDPLVEAAKGAMMEGEIRRQAIAAVNEEFGVYNRNAVIREHLAAYDAAIEEAYKCMKEGKPLSPKQQKMASLAGDPKKIDAADLASLRKGAKIDEKKGCYEESDGLPPSDAAKQAGARQQAQTPSSTPARTGNAAGATIAKAKDALNELTKPTGKTAMMAFRRAERSDDETNDYTRTNRLFNWKQKHLPGKSARNQKNTGKAELPDYSEKDSGYVPTVKKSGKLMKSTEKATKAEIKSRLGKHTKPKHLPEESLDEAVSRKHFQQVADLIKGHESQEKRNELASHHAGIFAKQNPRFDHARFHKAAGSTAHEAPKKMEEAAYSAKAARAGKDIGKPGKSFSMIAKKAGERYGSEEKGKKVAGAILAKIRAKHMKEEQIDEVVRPSDIKAGETLGQAMNRLQGKTAIKGGKNDPSSPNFAGPKPASTATSSSSGGDTGYKSDGGRTVSLKPMADTGSAQAAEPPKAAPTPAAQPKGWSAPKEPSQSDTVAASGAPKASAATSSMDTADSGADKMPRIDSGPKLNPNKPGLQESVQVGTNRYRIV